MALPPPMRQTWLWARAAVPHMQRQNSGSIITLASQLAMAGGRNSSAYIAAKGAIVSLTRTMAVGPLTWGAPAFWSLPLAVRSSRKKGVALPGGIACRICASKLAWMAAESPRLIAWMSLLATLVTRGAEADAVTATAAANSPR